MNSDNGQSRRGIYFSGYFLDVLSVFEFVLGAFLLIFVLPELFSLGFDFFSRDFSITVLLSSNQANSFS